MADEGAQGLAALDAMEEEELAASFETGQIDLNMDALQVDSRLSDEIGQGVMSSAKSYSSLIKSAVDMAGDDNPIDQLIQFNRLRDEVMSMQINTQDDIFNPEAAAQYQTAMTKLQDAIAKNIENPNRENAANLQLAYADYISTLADIMPEFNKIMANLQQMEHKTQTLEKQRTQILGDEAAEPTPEEVDADQGLVSNTKIQARIDALEHKINSMKAIMAQLSDPTTKPEEIPALLDDLATLSTDVQKLMGNQETEGSIQAGFQNAEALVDAAGACVSQNISEALLAQLNAKIKNKTGDRRIEDLSPEDLRNLYQDLRESQFSQAAILRNAARTLQNSLQKILNGTQLTASEHARAAEALATLQGSSELSQEDRNLLGYAKTALSAEGEISNDTRIGVNGTLARLGSIQGECQRKMQDFNREVIGRIRGILKDKHGMSDAQIDAFLAVGLDTPMPESPLAPSAAPAAPAESAAASTTAPAQPQLNSNTQALLALAESISSSTPIIDEQNGTIQINGQVYNAKELANQLQGIDQTPLTDQQKRAIDQAVALLEQMQPPSVEVNPVISATVTSSAAPEAAQPVQVAQNDDTEDEDEQLDDYLEDVFKALGRLEGAFDAAARATSGSQLALLEQMSKEASAEARV